MGRWLKQLRRTRFVYRSSSSFTKTVVATALVLSVVALAAVGYAIHDTQRRTQDLKDKAAQLEQDVSDLEDNVEALGSADSVDQIAKDELGLVDPNTVVIKPSQSPEK